MHMIITDKPYGRVHQDQRTGLPARWVGPGVGAGELPNLLPETPPASAFFNPDEWYPIPFEAMTRQERKDYKRQYPVV